MEFQSPVLVITQIKPQGVAPLKGFLTELNRKLWHEQVNPFGDFNRQHFARWVIVDEQLIFAAAVDGQAQPYLEELANHCCELLNSIYYHCENFPESSHPAPESISNYLLAHQETSHMFYHGLRNRSVRDIQLESQIHRSVQVFLDGNQDSSEFKSLLPRKIIDTIKAHLKGTGITYGCLDKFFFSPLSPATQANRWWRLPTMGLLLIVILCLTPLILLMEWFERQHPAKASPFVENNRASDLDFEEILAVQSPMTSIVAIKPGVIRHWCLRSTLWIIQVLADYVYNKGNLGSIGTIHFARWAIINNGKHLLFLSNYDGSWESYLGDFIDRAALGLTAVWNNALGFPNAFLLIFGGAAKAEEFKRYAKRSQIATHFWYSAYPHTSMENKLNNRAVREYLIQGKLPAADDWLQRF
ncbi:MAG: hypothetical protein MI976_08765 [Pseudomonadales bacterium]|nr:hypothetical protein [Pseudomonadales bacterium]